MTQRTGGEATASLLERDTERARLAVLLGRAAAGEGAAAAIVGPAGIGKTSLLTETLARGAEAGLRVLTARGGEIEREFPYGVARQLFEREVRDGDDARREALLAQAAAPAASVLGLPGPPSADEFASVHGLYWLCANLADEQPLLLAVDDLHWCDVPSLRFLAYVAGRLGEAALMLLVASRPAAGADLTALVDARHVERIALGPLSVAAVADLLQIDVRAAEACHRSGAGNPFLCQVAATDFADGVTSDAGDVGALVLRRIGRLPEQAVVLLRAAAVLSDEAPLAQVAAVAELPLDDAAQAAAALEQQGLVRGGATIAFEHPLVRAAVADTLPGALRALLHARAARVLRAAHAPAAAIALHLCAAPGGDDAQAVDDLRRAADEAAATGALGPAVGYLRRALAEPAHGDTRLDVLSVLARLQVRLSCPIDALATIDEALTLADDPRRRVALLSARGGALVSAGDLPAAVAAFEQARAAAASADPDRALAIESELIQWHVQMPGQMALVEAARERADGDPVTAGGRSLLAAQAFAHVIGGGTAAQTARVGQSSIDGGLLGDFAAGGVLWINAVCALICADEFASAGHACEIVLGDRAIGPPSAGHATRALLHLRCGRLREAEADARNAYELGLGQALFGLTMACGILVETLVHRGELAAAEDALARARRREGALPLTWLEAFTLMARGRWQLACARPSAALEDMEDMRRREADWGAWNPALHPTGELLAAAALAGGDGQRALAAAQEDLTRARAYGASRAIGIAQRTLALSGPESDRGELLAASVETLAPTGAALEHARSLVELGAHMRRTGVRAAAREPLHQGMELAAHCGAVPLTARAREELLATGARPRRTMRSGLEALTPSELRVARLAATGQTNREIAQELYITMRTVQTHLAHAYQKLDLEGRAELAAALADSAPCS